MKIKLISIITLLIFIPTNLGFGEVCQDKLAVRAAAEQLGIRAKELECIRRVFQKVAAIGTTKEIKAMDRFAFARKIGAREFTRRNYNSIIIEPLFYSSPETWERVKRLKKGMGIAGPAYLRDYCKAVRKTPEMTGPGIYYCKELIFADEAEMKEKDDSLPAELYDRSSFVHELLEEMTEEMEMIDTGFRTETAHLHPLTVEGQLRFACLIGEEESMRKFIGIRIDDINYDLETIGEDLERQDNLLRARSILEGLRARSFTDEFQRSSQEMWQEARAEQGRRDINDAVNRIKVGRSVKNSDKVKPQIKVLLERFIDPDSTDGKTILKKTKKIKIVHRIKYLITSIVSDFALGVILFCLAFWPQMYFLFTGNMIFVFLTVIILSPSCLFFGLHVIAEALFKYPSFRRPVATNTFFQPRTIGLSDTWEPPSIAHELGHFISHALKLEDKSFCLGNAVKYLAFGESKYQSDKAYIDYRSGLEKGRALKERATTELYREIRNIKVSLGLEIEEEDYSHGAYIAGITRALYPDDDKAAFQFLISLFRDEDPVLPIEIIEPPEGSETARAP